MCGLAGVLTLDGSAVTPKTLESVRDMLEATSYRGPDDRQLFQAPYAVLGFNRLSIVDLVGGRQPILNEDGMIALVCNGEIFNADELRRSLPDHHFRSRSDCEVIIHLYESMGIDFVSRLEGMFAFVLWDERKQSLILGRDHFGIKPLFYSLNHSRLMFASEIKALLASQDCPSDFDWESAFSDPWLSGFPATNLTNVQSYFKDIEQLPAGTIMEVNRVRRHPRIVKYWSLDSFGVDDIVEKDAAHYVDEYHALLAESVERCFISDVEVGVFLSGGIDSAAITALAAFKGHAFHTFSVLSQSTFANGDAEMAHTISKELGVPNHQLLFQDDSYPSPDEWKRLLWLSETPFCGPEQVFKYQLHRLARMVRPSLKVILTGQGSDEFNGGYSTLFAPEPNASWPEFIQSLDLLERGRHLTHSPLPLFSWDRHFDVPIVSQNFLANLAFHQSFDPWNAYVQTKYRDLQMYNCWHEDRLAAGNSIENRVPFLDHKLVELTLRVPSQLRSTLFWDKSILRRAMDPYLSATFTQREKVPFFYGPQVKAAHRMMLNVYLQDNYALVHEAFDDQSSVVNKHALIQALNGLNEDPELVNMEFMSRLINMGLLAVMAKTQSKKAPVPCLSLKPVEYVITDWNEKAPQLSYQFAGQSLLDSSLVPSLRRGVALVPSNDEYVTVDGELAYIISETDNPELLTLVKAIDGKRTIRNLEVVTGLSTIRLSQLIKELQQANVIE